MSARDPVAVLHQCAVLLPLGGDAAQTLLCLARNADRHVAQGRLLDILDYQASEERGRTPDERAAFALAREALTPVAGVEGGAK